MKSLLALTLISFASISSFAAPQLAIDCTPPKNFAGHTANVSGVLNLTPMANGATKGEGKLQISLNNARNRWAGEKVIIGQYDDLTQAGRDRYFNGGAIMQNNNDILALYANFTRPDLSYIEYAGSTYKMSCKSKLKK